jgi:hypothetical protein
MHYTNFKCYRETIFKIVDKIYADNHIYEVGAYVKKLSDDEKIGLFQHTREINTADRSYLNKKHKKITVEVIKRYIQIYDNLSSAFEKYARLLVWIKTLLDGKEPNYDNIKGGNLSNHVGFLMNDLIFRNLALPFNTVIRNAITHRPQTIIDPLLQSIRFLDSKDNRKDINVGFSEFVAKTKELGADVYILSMIGTAINLRYTEKVSEYLKNLTKPGPSYHIHD